VIDAYVRVSLVGIELLTIDARIVIASVDTYLRSAEAVNRLDLREDSSQGLPELMESVTSGGSTSKTKGVLEGAKEALVGSDDDEGIDKPRAAAFLVLAPAEEQLSTQTSRRRRLPTPCGRRAANRKRRPRGHLPPGRDREELLSHSRNRRDTPSGLEAVDLDRLGRFRDPERPLPVRPLGPVEGAVDVLRHQTGVVVEVVSIVARSEGDIPLERLRRFSRRQWHLWHPGGMVRGGGNDR
jgi:gas vesicle structural protein